MTDMSLIACIFDVDGVLLASPHERAWRESLKGFADPSRFTTEMYQAEVAGKSRLDGALAALRSLGVADAAQRAPAYAERKQARLLALIADGHVTAFPDALRFAQAVASLKWPLGVASSSKNATAMMASITLASGRKLLDLFTANFCGRDLKHGKPDPEIFLLTAGGLGVHPARCLVVEDASSGIEAARRGKMAALGVARLGDRALLAAAGATLVVTSLDAVDLGLLAQGQLGSVPA